MRLAGGAARSNGAVAVPHSMPSTLLWFRQDLRLQDNPALMAALARGEPVVPVYVLDDAGDGAWPAGGASDRKSTRLNSSPT